MSVSSRINVVKLKNNLAKPKNNLNLVVYVLFIVVVVLLVHGFIDFNMRNNCQSVENLPIESYCEPYAACDKRYSCYRCAFGSKTTKDGTKCKTPQD